MGRTKEREKVGGLVMRGVGIKKRGVRGLGIDAKEGERSIICGVSRKGGA